MLSTNLLAFAKKRHAEIARPRRRPLMGLCLAMALMAAAGCGDNPGKWPKAQLSEHVKQSLIGEGVDVTEVTLTEKESGVYDGVGKVAGGETLKLNVYQDPAAHRITWDAEGDRGSILDGSYELK